MRNDNDKESVLKAVSQDGYDLQYASKELRNDKDIVMAALSQNEPDLQHPIGNNKDVVIAAVSNNGWALQCASEELRNDREFLRKLYSINKDVINYIDPKYRDFVMSPSLDDIIDKAENECYADTNPRPTLGVER